jgi:hypothetical protein
LVDEVINGRDKVVEELMGVRRLEKWIRGRKIRERGELGERDLWFWDILVYGKVRKFGEEEGGGQETTVLLEQFFLRTLTGA